MLNMPEDGRRIDSDEYEKEKKVKYVFLKVRRFRRKFFKNEFLFFLIDKTFFIFLENSFSEELRIDFFLR